MNIDDIGVRYHIERIKRVHDVTWLVNRLRDHDRTIPPELRNFVATLLEQEYKSKKSTKAKHTAYRNLFVKCELLFWKDVLGGAKDSKGELFLPWNKVKEILKEAGIQGKSFDTKGELTEAARIVTAYVNNISLSQLSEIVEPRKSREKKY